MRQALVPPPGLVPQARTRRDAFAPLAVSTTDPLVAGLRSIRWIAVSRRSLVALAADAARQRRTAAVAAAAAVLAAGLAHSVAACCPADRGFGREGSARPGSATRTSGRRTDRRRHWTGLGNRCRLDRRSYRRLRRRQRCRCRSSYRRRLLRLGSCVTYLKSPPRPPSSEPTWLAVFCLPAPLGALRTELFCSSPVRARNSAGMPPVMLGAPPRSIACAVEPPSPSWA